MARRSSGCGAENPGSADRPRRLSRPDGVPRAGAPADGADRRRRGAGASGSACRWSMISAPPTWRRAGRARRSSRSTTGRSPPRSGLTRHRRHRQYRRRRQHHADRRRRLAHRRRHRTGQCADRRLRARADRRADGRGRRARRAGHGRRTRLSAALLANPWFARPMPKSLDRNAFSLGAGRRPLDRGRRGDACRLHFCEPS